MKSNKIGIFAGAFDPFHQGHASFIRAALEHVEHIYLMPEPLPRHKPRIRDISEREADLRLALTSSNLKNTSIFISKLGSFNVKDSLRELHDAFSNVKLHFMFGDDVVNQMATWQDLEFFAQQANLIIATRYKNKEAIIEELDRLSARFHYEIIEINEPISSSKIRAQKASQ